MVKPKRGSGAGSGSGQGIVREDKLVDEDYSSANGPWSASVEVHFFDAIEYYPPAGAHVYLNILNIRNYLKRAAGVEFTPQQILDRVAHYWNVEGPNTLTLKDVKSQYELFLEDGADEESESDDNVNKGGSGSSNNSNNKVDYSVVWAKSFALPKEFSKLVKERYGAMDDQSPDESPVASTGSATLSSSSSSSSSSMPSTKRRKT